MNISDKRFDGWKIVITSPACSYAAIGPNGSVAIYQPATGEVVWILPPAGMAAIITELDRENKAIEQLKIEADHWKEAYYEERAKYLNLINNK